jgi:carbon monoxide dehydrogenase subunit G
VDLRHTFSVPASVDQTWAAFQDIESVAECFPGAQVTSVEGDSFEGTCKVKLGPIALVYTGSGHFVSKDESAHRMVIEAKGKDKRGNGTAGATVTAQLTDTGGATEVEVVTDLHITGKPAQFGRGVMQDVSDKLLGLFVDCLQDKVGSDGHGGAEPNQAAAASPTPAPPPAPGEATAGPAGTPAPERPAPERPAPEPPAPEPAALDLGSTVLPVLAKAYWKQAVAAIAVVVIVGLRLRSARPRRGRPPRGRRPVLGAPRP